MKKQLFLLYGLLFCIVIAGCKETVHEYLQISIQNGTDSLIHIHLYPKAKYLSEKGGLYRSSDIGGEWSLTEFSLSPNADRHIDWNSILFESGDLNIESYTLAKKIFDSICINTVNEDSAVVTMKFTHEHASGYSENIFSENSTWDYKVIEWEFPNQFRQNPANYHYHSFLILKDNFEVQPENAGTRNL